MKMPRDAVILTKKMAIHSVNVLGKRREPSDREDFGRKSDGNEASDCGQYLPADPEDFAKSAIQCSIVFEAAYNLDR